MKIKIKLANDAKDHYKVSLNFIITYHIPPTPIDPVVNSITLLGQTINLLSVKLFAELLNSQL